MIEGRDRYACDLCGWHCDGDCEARCDAESTACADCDSPAELRSADGRRRCRDCNEYAL